MIDRAIFCQICIAKSKAARSAFIVILARPERILFSISLFLSCIRKKVPVMFDLHGFAGFDDLSVAFKRC